MAEDKAGSSNAQSNEQLPENKDGEGEVKPRVYSQEEMDRITAKVRKNAARDAELRLRRETPPQQQQQAPTKEDPPKEDEAPKREAFEDYESYIEARADWRAKKAAREERVLAEKERRDEQQREHHEKAAQTWHGKIEAAKEKLPDFQIVLEDNDAVLDVIYGSKMREAITESDIGPQLVYELCKTPAEAKRIAALPGYKQAAEIVKLEEKLTAAAPKEGEDDEDEKDEKKDDDDGAPDQQRDDGGRFKPKKETPKADDPIEPVGPRPAGASAEPSDKDDTATWHRKRVAQLARRRNPGR